MAIPTNKRVAVNLLHLNVLSGTPGTTRTYDLRIRDRIEPGINDWLMKNSKGKYQITKRELDTESMMVRVTTEFEKSTDAWEFRVARIPILKTALGIMP